jgi:hypothetical protein
MVDVVGDKIERGGQWSKATRRFIVNTPSS